jgi:hypothetical protein
MYNEQTCSPSFQTKYVNINGKKIYVEEYIKNIESLKRFGPPTCDLKHELVLADGKIVRPYFRHKFRGDCKGYPMSAWHAEWQSNFETTEFSFSRKNSDQIKSRRADAYLPNFNTIVEFQHSEMKKEEVDARKNDYGEYKMNIVWIIDGNSGIRTKELEYSQRVYLEFTSEHWKYTSFLNYDTIYIDIQEKIYKINPKNVKSHMIDVEVPKDKFEFISALKRNEDLWDNIDPHQCNLFIKQQGAGNGKTYGIIQMLASKEASHYKNFILVTKQHSAKDVIYNELTNQMEGGKLPSLEKIYEDEVNKKYIIKFTKKETNEECQIIIATIDSLMHAIGDKKNKHFDKFEGLVYSIIDNFINTDKAGTIAFGGIRPKLNKETLLVIDETQDLTEIYAHAINNIMRNKYVDAYIVGDRLQSISIAKNAFVYLSDNELPYISVNKLQATNVCRRFTHKKLVDFVNTMVPFKDYNLPEIVPYKDDNTNTNPIIFFQGESLFSSSSSESTETRMNNEVKKFMTYFCKEVEEYNRVPEDFMIITPFTSNNPFVDAIQLSLNIYWKERLGNNSDDYTRYAIFHKSEEGSSIDLRESSNSVRIVSTHSSKGDQRKVVFVVGFSESALKRFSITSNNLVYNSLFHVALTRMQEKLYIRYENNADDISQKINRYIHKTNYFISDIKPNLFIYNSVRYNDCIDEFGHKAYDQFKSDIIDKGVVDTFTETKKAKKIIDMGNHTIRYSSLLINILTLIVNKEQKNNDDLKAQIKAELHKISKSEINLTTNWVSFNESISKKHISLIRLSNKGKDYIRYFDILLQCMNNIVHKLRSTLNHNLIPEFCPFECVVLYYMLEVRNNGSYADIHVTDLYDIVDTYSQSFNNSVDGHDKGCMCKKHFDFANSTKSNKSIEKMKEYIHSHYEKVKDIKKSLGLFHDKFPKISWLHNHVVKFNGNNENYKLWKAFTLIGYDEENVVVAYVKPQFNSLNYNETLIKSVFDTYLLLNTKMYSSENELSENYKRFHGKKIISCVLSLDKDEPFYIEWKSLEEDLIKDNDEKLRLMIKEYLKEKYISECSSIYYFYKYWRKNCPENERHPQDFVLFMKDKYNTLKEENERPRKNYPSFIDEFISNLKWEIDSCKDKKSRKAVLQKYDDDLSGKDEFMRKIDDVLEISINRYLGIRSNESDESSDED